jgi:hypothetical protein
MRSGEAPQADVGSMAFLLTRSSLHGAPKLVWLAYANYIPILPLPSWVGAVSWTPEHDDAHVVIVTSHAIQAEGFFYRVKPGHELGDWPFEYNPDVPASWPGGSRPASFVKWAISDGACRTTGAYLALEDPKTLMLRTAWEPAHCQETHWQIDLTDSSWTSVPVDVAR